MCIMAYMIDVNIDHEIQTAFSRDGDTLDIEKEPLKKLFRYYKKLTIKFLTRKWDISSLNSHISNKVIPRDLREKVVPAEHNRFMQIWKEECVNRGLNVMQLIVAEEEKQLQEIQEELENSAKQLEPYKQDKELTKKKQ